MSSSTSSAPGPQSQDDWLHDQLRALPDPPMPPAVADGILSALRAERPAPVSPAGTTTEDEPTASVTDIRRPPSRRRALLMGLAAAAAALVAITLVTNSPAGQQNEYDNVVALSAVQPVSTNVRYTTENIEESVVSHLRALETRSAAIRPAADAQRRGSFAANDDVMASCLAGVGAAQGNLRMVDLAEYQGQPSGILVFNDGGGNLIVVVAPRCTAEDPRVRLRLNAPGQ